MLCMMSSESSCHQHQFANQRYMYGPTHHHLLVAVHLVVSFPQEPGNEAIYLVACDLGARHSAPPPGLDLAHWQGPKNELKLSYMYNVCTTSLIPRLFPSFCYTTEKLGKKLGMRLCIIHEYLLYIGWLFHVDQASWWFTWRWYVQPGLSSPSCTCGSDNFDISPYL